MVATQHDGGGGATTTGGSATVVDHAGLSAATSTVRTAGDTLDATADSMPGTGGTGAAEVVIASIFAGFSDAAVQVMNEGIVLADLADECNTSYQTSDAEAAERFIVEGAQGER